SPKEDEYNHHNQNKADIEGGLHILNAADDGLRAVVGCEKHDGTGELRLNRRQHLADRLGHLDRIYPRAAKDTDEDVCPRLRVTTDPDTHVNAFVLHSLLGGCHIPQVNRSAVVLSDNQAVILICSHQLSLWLQQEAAMRTVELPGSGIGGP